MGKLKVLFAKMDDTSKFIDLSSYLVFEATGDSDQVFIPTNDEENDDDALSCCSDLSEINYNRKRKSDYRHVECGLKEDEDEEEEEEDGVVNQALKKPKQKDEELKSNKNNNVGYGVPARKMMGCQREQDKLFWDACLAS